MLNTPKSLRLQIGIFGRTNVGKSSFLNMVAGQDVSITSPVPGTTTDVVEKTMELLPLGPVVFLDTAGLDDTSVLAEARLARTRRIFDRADVAVLITEPEKWGDFETALLAQLRPRHIPCIVVVNKIDTAIPSAAFLASIQQQGCQVITCSSVRSAARDAQVNAFKEALVNACPEEFLQPASLLGGLVPANGCCVLVVPIDKEAPRGRIILPQVQAIRDCLDHDALVMVAKEREYPAALRMLTRQPDLVVCDSQVVLEMVADTLDTVACTTFSILFARFKGDLRQLVQGAAAIDRLVTGDKVLIAEACSHHAIEDDIGRVKIPRWLRQYTGADVQIDVCSGRDYPEHLEQYKVIIHCGSCMLTRRETLARLRKAREAGVGITNYGVCISLLQGVLERVLSPFPGVLDAWRACAVVQDKA